MNHVYRTIFNHATDQWAVAETARSRGKGGGSRRQCVCAATLTLLAALTLAAPAAFAQSHTYANGETNGGALDSTGDIP